MVGRHDWNSYRNYCEVHESVLERHPFVETYELAITPPLYDAHGVLFVVVDATVLCRNRVELVVAKRCAVRERARGGYQVRTKIFRYQAMRDRGELLRYDNMTGFDSYHVHRWDADGNLVDDHLPLTRDEMPHLSDVLNELQRRFV